MISLSILWNPLYLVICNTGIPLSNVTVFGGAIANMVLNTRKRHPLADRPLIDWDLILVMEPLTIAGALMGAFLNKILPEQFLTFMLVLLLSFTAYNSLKKAVKMYRKESRKLREQGLKPDGSKESELTHINQQEAEETMNEAGDELLEDMDLQDGESPGGGAALDGLPVDANEALLKKILEEERVTPIFNVKVLVGLFVVVLAMNLLKGGGAFPSPIGITCGSNAFWIANVIILGWIVVISIYARNYLVKRNNLKQRIGYQTMEGDIQWDERSTVVYPCICCLAGFFAGMFGSKFCYCYYTVLFLGISFSKRATHTLRACSRRRYCERSSHVGNGCSPGSSLCVVGMHDFFYEFHGNNFVLCVWFVGSPIRTRVLLHWICCNLLWTNWTVDIDATGQEKFVHCLFHRRCCIAECYFDDCTVVIEHGRGGTPQLGRNLWQGIIVKVHNLFQYTSTIWVR